jgi:hypothetical protein
MTLCLLSFGLGDLLDRHSVAVRVLLLVGVFLVGYAEAMILKSRGVASVTWLLALAAACIWIAYPATPIRIAVGSGAFLFGVVAMIIFYRKRPKDASR